MGKQVLTTPEADEHILEIDAWWRTHRDKAPDLFEQELALALRNIGAAPGIGKLYSHPSAKVRRVLLRATRHHVYYVERDDDVLVVAVWGGARGAGPDLSDIFRGR